MKRLWLKGGRSFVGIRSAVKDERLVDFEHKIAKCLAEAQTNTGRKTGIFTEDRHNVIVSQRLNFLEKHLPPQPAGA
ncbi:hypothetical protein GGC65_003463 [Sphingopyxis sp. OAS728]|uniref:hypothetical protein n=1 Tax=Sphingopyxis sp. OAS728 TaxID=2663823 RepID=UPI00178A325A|nr:hypothetical protein [Sphingopyxis sp. OAS728]MBE1529007.1 hypothetical protein [Sphingopyxis sp. OAS728]